MNLHLGYARAVTERMVPSSVLVEQSKQIHGKPEEEQKKLKDKFTEEILEKYPVKEKYRQSSNLLWIEDGSITELENNHRSYSAENPGRSHHSHF